jgi:hypothetical protein
MCLRLSCRGGPAAYSSRGEAKDLKYGSLKQEQMPDSKDVIVLEQKLNSVVGGEAIIRQDDKKAQANRFCMIPKS